MQTAQPQPDSTSKPKKTKFAPIDPIDEPEPHRILAEQRKHHPDLEMAQIRLVWLLHEKANKRTGKLTLGNCRKAPSLWQILFDVDLIIGLNRDWWHLAAGEQHNYLTDHELCHAVPDLDKHGVQRIDDRGNLQWAIIPHDLEEFHGPVERHGMRLSSVYAMYEKMRKAQQRLPFSFTGAETETLGLV